MKLALEASHSSSNSGMSMGPSYPPRKRTTFDSRQLHVMQSYFSMCGNPSNKDLEQLAQTTGLSERVIKVWFQNARARQRRENSNTRMQHFRYVECLQNSQNFQTSR
ncbi:LIM/homeobox protein Lhx9, partial [Stegodyphus mimosarum]